MTKLFQFFALLGRGVKVYLMGLASLKALYAFFILALYAYYPTVYTTYDMSINYTIPTAVECALDSTVYFPLLWNY
jgi:hypothetical protein